MPRDLLVSAALPYANGPIHLGHLVGYVQGDIWVRYQRLSGNTAHYVCADDAHGTPIMLAAEKAGMSPEAYAASMRAGHERDFADFGVAFDNYHTTHSEEDRELTEAIYARLDAGGYIARRTIEQFHDPVRGMFLPDRYIKGECPNCGTADQYGDNCENCGATYAPTDLKNPRSILSGATPELRGSEHYFFELPKFEAFLREWLRGDVAHSSVRAKLAEWLDAGLKDWDISRDEPYFGFPIPGAPGKYFYVWLDAPIGYFASFKQYCARTGVDFDRYVKPGHDTELHHFIGKDIVNFHGLFWPAVLKGSGFRVPTALHVNGYLTVNGVKMSKARGTFIMARTYLDQGLDPDWLRYYYAVKSSDGVVDLDLNLEDFVARVNSDLVGKFVNIASRCAKLLEQHFEGRLCADFWSAGAQPAKPTANETAAIQALATVAALCQGAVPRYERGQYGHVLVRAMEAADAANVFIANAAPWALAKGSGPREELHRVLSTGINLFKSIACTLKPVIPGIVARAEAFLAVPGGAFASFDDIGTPWANHQLAPFVQLTQRIDPARVEAMVAASTESLAPAANVASAAISVAGAVAGIAGAAVSAAAGAVAKAVAPPKPEPAADGRISIDDFMRVELRIARIVEAAAVPEADKLLRLKLDLGTEQRQVFAGIKSAYAPEQLVGRLVIVVANLQPRQMQFGIS
ncbi:MAG TPA: methionine--tRNA ligase, partial [Xanthomonadales bacterium]|nr:methionine--tRNA ligase [Xanthomonadales bacterium]